MRLLVISHAAHFIKNEKIYSYGPLVKEMVLWENCVEEMVLFAPRIQPNEDQINLSYEANTTKLINSPSLNFTSLPELVKSSAKLPIIILKMIWQFHKADHIHLRCPGNLALIGCLIQIFFPFKKKTAKYAGNWDWESQQPFSYKLQQQILRNTWLTKNMTALVYGNWPNKTENIKSFFTASYFRKDFVPFEKPSFEDGIKLIFVGGLVKGKNPIISIQVLKLLIDLGEKSSLVYCGEGPERHAIEQFAKENRISEHVEFRGNINTEQVKKEFIKAHFLVFLSDSEGWPKVVAESMTWSCIPITSAVSCVSEMVGEGKRGVLVSKDPHQILKVILELKNDPARLAEMQVESLNWAKQYTLESFGEEIKKLL